MRNLWSGIGRAIVVVTGAVAMQSAAATSVLTVTDGPGASNVLQNSATLWANITRTNGGGLIVTNSILLSNLTSGAKQIFSNTATQFGKWSTNVSGLSTFNPYSYRAAAADNQGATNAEAWSAFTTKTGSLVTNIDAFGKGNPLIINTNTGAVWINLGNGSSITVGGLPVGGTAVATGGLLNVASVDPNLRASTNGGTASLSISNNSVLANIIADPVTNADGVSANGGTTNGQTLFQFNGAPVNKDSSLTAISAVTTNVIFSFTASDGSGHTNTLFIYPNRNGDGSVYIVGPANIVSNWAFNSISIGGGAQVATWRAATQAGLTNVTGQKVTLTGGTIISNYLDVAGGTVTNVNQLYSASGGGVFYSSSGTPVAYFDSQLLRDAIGHPSADWNVRALYGTWVAATGMTISNGALTIANGGTMTIGGQSATSFAQIVQIGGATGSGLLTNGSTVALNITNSALDAATASNSIASFLAAGIVTNAQAAIQDRIDSNNTFNTLANGNYLSATVSNSMYYGQATWHQDSQNPESARPVTDFIRIQVVSFDPYFRTFSVLGDPNRPYVTTNSPSSLDVPASMRITNSTYPNGVYVQFMQRIGSNNFSVSTSTNNYDWSYVRDVPLTNDGTLALSVVSATRPWVSPTDNSLWIYFQCFTNGFAGNWVDYAVKATDSTFTNYTAPRHLTGDATFSTSGVSSFYDLWPVSDGGTNFLAASAGNSVSLFYTTNALPTNGFVTAWTGLFTGEAPNLLPNPWRIIADPHTGLSSWTPSGGNPLTNAWTQMGRGGPPIVLRAAAIHQAVTLAEQQDVLNGLNKSALLNAALNRPFAGQSLTNGFSDLVNLRNGFNAGTLSAVSGVFSQFVKMAGMRVGMQTLTNNLSISVITTNMTFLGDCTSNAVTLTLPTLSGLYSTGTVIFVEKVDTTTNLFTITTGSSTRGWNAYGQSIVLSNQDDGFGAICTLTAGTNFWRLLFGKGTPINAPTNNFAANGGFTINVVSGPTNTTLNGGSITIPGGGSPSTLTGIGPIGITNNIDSNSVAGVIITNADVFLQSNIGAIPLTNISLASINGTFTGGGAIWLNGPTTISNALAVTGAITSGGSNLVLAGNVQDTNIIVALPASGLGVLYSSKVTPIKFPIVTVVGKILDSQLAETFAVAIVSNVVTNAASVIFYDFDSLDASVHTLTSVTITSSVHFFNGR